jgi:hypothetical protein
MPIDRCITLPIEQLTRVKHEMAISHVAEVDAI